MNFLVAAMLYILANFGVNPPDNTLYTHVWGKCGPIEVNNVESYVESSVVVWDKQFSPGIEDHCAIYATIILFDDGVLAIQLERDCQAVEHSYIAVYVPSITGMRFVEY